MELLLEAEEDFTLYTTDGLKLHGHCWQSATAQVRGIICLVHGYAEHLMRYQHVVHFLVQQGFAVYGMDLRGHGHSQGRRAHGKSMERMLNDVELLLMRARADHNDAPMFLMGHSWGGSIVLNFIVKRGNKELHGAIVSAPWLQLFTPPSPTERKLARVVSKIWPALKVPNRIQAQMLSKVPEVVQAFGQDPLVQSKATIGTVLFTQAAGQFVLQNAHKIKLPVLLYHGQADTLIDPAPSQQLAELVPQHITFYPLEQVRHEPHNDTEQAQVFSLITQWLNTQLGATVAAS